MPLNAEKQKMANRVLDALMEGRSLREICGDKRDKELIPTKKTFLVWVRDHEELQGAYLVARAIREDLFFDEVVSIADGEGHVGADTHERIQRDKLRVDSRKWALGRMNPKKYGDLSQRGEGDENKGKVHRKTTEYVADD